MKYYMIIATVNDIDYLTKVNAESESSAEHMVLDLGVCGKHTYGVTACMVYSEGDMKYDEFIYRALESEPVSFETLKEIIKERNIVIMKKDEAEDRIREIEKSMKELQNELEQAKAILSA